MNLMLRRMVGCLAGFICVGAGQAQTAHANALKQMLPEEQEMIKEINLVRRNPSLYITFLKPLLAAAKHTLETEGKGSPNYSLTFSGSAMEKENVDTTWHYTNEEEVKALESLISDLKKLKPLSVLIPDTGIYRATVLFAEDQQAHQWKLMHTGSDGSHPWNRIMKHAPAMAFGNENLAGNMPCSTPRGTVIQLLIDSGIPGYGHRYNLLNPQWTHVACKRTQWKPNYCWWIQNFGEKKKPGK